MAGRGEREKKPADTAVVDADRSVVDAADEAVEKAEEAIAETPARVISIPDKRLAKAWENLVAWLESIDPKLVQALLAEARIQGPERLLLDALRFKVIVQQAMAEKMTLADYLMWLEIHSRIEEYLVRKQARLIALQNEVLGTFSHFLDSFTNFMQTYSQIYASAEQAARESEAMKVLDTLAKQVVKMMNSMMRRMGRMFKAMEQLGELTMLQPTTQRGKKR